MYDVMLQRIYTLLNFIDTQERVTSFTQHIDISSNHSDVLLPLHCCGDMDSVTVVGILSLDSNHAIDITHVTLYPSILLIGSEPSSNSTVNQSSTISPTTRVLLPLPSINAHRSSLDPLSYSAVTGSSSWSDILLAVLVSSLCTAIIVSIISIVGCVIAYKHGRNGFYSYSWVNSTRSDANAIETETYFVQSVNTV